MQDLAVACASALASSRQARVNEYRVSNAFQNFSTLKVYDCTYFLDYFGPRVANKYIYVQVYKFHHK